MEIYHAIEIIGYGRNARYCVRSIKPAGRYGSPLIAPAIRKAFRTELDARDAAEQLGIEILKVGDIWHII